MMRNSGYFTGNLLKVPDSYVGSCALLPIVVALSNTHNATSKTEISTRVLAKNNIDYKNSKNNININCRNHPQQLPWSIQGSFVLITISQDEGYNGTVKQFLLSETKCISRANIIYFPSNFFSKRTFISLVRLSFPLLKLPMTRRHRAAEHLVA